MNYEVKEQMYEGKAKQVFATSDPEIVMVHYKDDATAGDGEKKGTIRDKGIVNNKLSNALMQKLEKEGIPTHYVQEINDRDTFVKKVEIVPLEVIIRNVAAGHFTLRMGVPEGTEFKTPILEANIRLIDFKVEFGRLSDGTIILADEISPDTCRFWDATTGAHLDKDLFRRNLGGEADAYQEVMKRLLG